MKIHANWIKNPESLFDIRGKVAVVTGASGAFGSLAAQVLAGAGANLLLAGGNEKVLFETKEACAALGAKVSVVIKRPSSEKDCEAIVSKAVADFGGVDILVVGSGLNDPCPIEDMSVERFEAVMDGNITGAWLICKAFGKVAIPQGRGGKVILVSSARGKLGHPAGYSAYCASKAATDGLTKALGCEWGK